MKKLSCLILSVILFTLTSAQKKTYDSLAIRILDRMSSIIGDMTSCSFTAITESNYNDPDLGMLTRIAEHDVMFSGNNKFQVMTHGERGHLGVWFNAGSMVYYSYTNNHFGYLDSIGKTNIEAIENANKRFDIEFPAADIFYPTFTDDLIASADRIEYLGKSVIGGKECYHIAARGKDLGFQVWINTDATLLPVRMNIIQYDKQSQQYNVLFKDWVINPNLPDALFAFDPPPDASKMKILPK
jgi:hypothetical protein